jgi:hypothetical protein
MTEDRKAKMLERVRALLAKADGTNFPEEADAFRAKADALMTEYAIEAWQMDPKPSDKLSYEENLAMLKEAGLGWPEITRLMVNAGMLEYKVTTTKQYSFNEGKEVNVELAKPWMERKNYAKPAHDYRNWCKKTGTPQSYTDWRTYRRNFADGYVDAVDRRLRVMRREQRGAYDAAHEAGGMELVVRDIRHAIDELMWEVFPDLAPHPPDCECDKCHFEKCNDPKCERTRCKNARKPVRYARGPMQKIDYAARAAGEKAGKEAQIVGNQHKRMGNRKELDR